MPSSRSRARRAVIAALTLAGLPTDRFLFAGFLPSKAKARADAIAEIAGVRATPGLLRERSAPRRSACGPRRRARRPRDAAVAREISKLHEETVTGSLPELAERYADLPPKGEIVIVVGPARGARKRATRARRALDEALKTMSPSRAAAEVAVRLEVPRKRAYARGAGTLREVNRRGSRKARPRRGNPRLLVAAPAWLAHPRAARPSARRRGRHRRSPRTDAGFRRGEGARDE